MKLKTLKDLRDKYYRRGISMKFFEELRQEAIKWIKEIKEHREKGDNSSEEQDVGGIKVIIYYYEQDDATPMIRWIRHFFNITEEELKQEGVEK